MIDPRHHEHHEWHTLQTLKYELRLAEKQELAHRRNSPYPVPTHLIERQRNLMQKIELQRAKMGLES